MNRNTMQVSVLILLLALACSDGSGTDPSPDTAGVVDEVLALDMSVEDSQTLQDIPAVDPPDTVVTNDPGEPQGGDVAEEDTKPAEEDTKPAEEDTKVEEEDVVEVADSGPIELPAGLNGKPVDGTPSLPLFSMVKDTQNQLVKPDIFMGHWTVLWFYPKAATTG